MRSHNGLFVMGDHYGLFLWNPSINKVKGIEEPDFPSHWRGQATGCGVGFCKKDEEDLKVVSFGVPLPGHNYVPLVQESVVSIYSMSTDSWKTIQGIYIPGDSSNNSEVTLDGVPHWIARSWEENGIFMSFNFDKEEFGQVMLPIPIASQVLGIYKGLLSIFWCSKVYSRAEGSGADYEMWVLSGYGGEQIWTKLFFFQQTVCGLPICMGYNGDVLLSKADNGKICTLNDTGEVLLIPYELSVHTLGHQNFPMPVGPTVNS
ncbi:hypothetical protein Tsubulata_011663 [Turnera subulata]|uniref:F-box associated beta-propeller type 1 domain-containing protein n=1 Tax=Turnera subulata TaxID=218843 RepID=A0A9Q0G569_9ROSI|nr:hypothetical protein Tsubulata_011663 [Turnera subulata]